MVSTMLCAEKRCDDTCSSSSIISISCVIVGLSQRMAVFAIARFASRAAIAEMDGNRIMVCAAGNSIFSFVSLKYISNCLYIIGFLSVVFLSSHW